MMTIEELLNPVGYIPISKTNDCVLCGTKSTPDNIIWWNNLVGQYICDKCIVPLWYAQKAAGKV